MISALLECKDTLELICHLVDDLGTAAILPAVCHAFRQSCSLRSWLKRHPQHVLGVLKRAAQHGSVADVKMLLDLGADCVDWEDSQGAALDSACWELCKQTALVDALTQRHVHSAVAMLGQAGCSRCDVACLLLDSSSNSSSSIMVKCALWRGASNGHVGFIERLLAANMDVHGDHELALGFAARHLTMGNVATAMALLHAGADVKKLFLGHRRASCSGMQPVVLAGAGVDVHACAGLHNLAVQIGSKRLRQSAKELWPALLDEAGVHGAGSMAQQEARAVAHAAAERIKALIHVVEQHELAEANAEQQTRAQLALLTPGVHICGAGLCFNVNFGCWWSGAAGS